MLRGVNNNALGRMNKKGDERVLSIYWFLMFVIIAIGIGSAVVLFYGKPLDIREKEASILSDKIIGCIVEKGILKPEALEGIKEGKIEGECNLYFNDNSLPTYSGKQEYFVRIRVEKTGDEGRDYDAHYGDMNFEPFCGQKDSRINIAFCSMKRFYALNEKGEFVLVEITSAIGKVEQNAIG